MEKLKHPKKERKDFAFGISLSESLISVAAGISGAFITASNKVTELFDSDQRKAKSFEDHFEGVTKTVWEAEEQKRLDAGLPSLERERPIGRVERLNEVKFENFKKPSEYWNKLAEVKASIYEDYLATIKRVHGISSKPIIGTIERLRTLSPGNKKALVVPGAIGAAIGTAMTLGFVNGIATRDKIERIDDAIQDNLKQLIEFTPADSQKKTDSIRVNQHPREEVVTSEHVNGHGHTKPASHVDKLVAESVDNNELAAATR